MAVDSEKALGLPADRRSAPVEIHTGPAVADLKQQFDELNRFITARSGWIVSVPGSEEIRIECLVGSPLPAELAKLGYDVQEDGEGQRILPTAVVEKFTKNADGSLGFLTEGSTQPVMSTVSHAGIAKVLRFRFSI